MSRLLPGEVSRHFTEKKAREVSTRLNKGKYQLAGRSTGWSRFDYSFKKVNNGFKRWVVFMRSQRT